MSASAGGDGTPSEGAGRTGQRITGNGSDYAGGYAGGVQPCRGCAEDADKRSSAARTLFAIRNTSLFDLFISQVGNEEAVNKLLEENLDEDGNPRPLKKGGKRNNGGVDWRGLV